MKKQMSDVTAKWSAVFINENIWKLFVGVILILSFATSITKILFGFDIDEAYALAMPFRMLQGDRLFADMWEVHQTSSFLPLIFMKLYEIITGSMDGVVIYMRVVTTLLHLLMSFFLYKYILYDFPDLILRTKERNALKLRKRLSFFMAVFYYSFLPKWMINMDFSILQLWFFTAFVLCFLSACKRRGRWGFFWSGILLALAVLAYPGMVLVYPVALILLLLDHSTQLSERWKRMACLTAGCAAVAVVFFIYLFSYLSPAELLTAVPKVFMDGSHQYNMSTKLSIYAKQWMEVVLQSAVLLLPALLLTFAGNWLYEKTGLDKKYGALQKLYAFVFVYLLLSSGIVLVAPLLGIAWGPFRLQTRYLIQFAMAFFLLKLPGKRHQSNALILWLSLGSFAGILLASNVGPVSSASYLILGNMVFVLMLIMLSIEGRIEGKAMLLLQRLSLLLLLLSLLMCKGFYIRNTEYVPGNILQSMEQVKEGPLRGVISYPADVERYTSDYETIKSNTTLEDQVLFMGTEGLGNLYANGKVVLPTTISTPAFNEQWVDYFESHPDKCPTIIFLAKNTVDDRDKFFSKNVFGIWIAERFDVECMEETDSLCIIRLRK